MFKAIGFVFMLVAGSNSLNLQMHEDGTHLFI